MTAPDYVAQAAELLGVHKARGFSHHDECHCGWPIPDANGWSNQAAHRTHQAEVLAAAGLIPTRTEWGVATPCVPTCPTAPHVSSEDFGGYESTARELVADVERATLVSRAVTDWKDA